MKDLGNKKFEESWKDAFAGAEGNPSENVWTNIDLQLSRTESGDMKRSVVFYQRLAAASIILALLTGGMGVWYLTKEGTQQLANTQINGDKNIQKSGSHEVENESSIKGNRVPYSASEGLGNNVAELEKENTASDDYLGDKVATNKTKGNEKPGNGLTQTKMPISIPSKQLAVARTSDELIDEGKGAIAKGHEPVATWRNIVLSSGTWSSAELKLAGQPVEEIADAKKMAKPTVAKVEVKKKSNDDEDWWASVGGAAGSYNPQATASASPALQSQFNGSATAPTTNRATVGTSYSFGMTFGKKVAQRWVVLSGVNYLNQSIGYNSNIAVLDATSNQAKAYTLDLANQSATIAPTSPYTVNSVNEFVSIPLQAGYLFIDRKVGLQLNAGVATDIFIKNTLIDQSGKLPNYSETAGNNSSYQALNWAGLVGTELSYKVAKHYRVSLVPGLRYSFNSVLKSSTGPTLNPLVLDVGFRFRYIF
jgi:hypothetical protein